MTRLMRSRGALVLVGLVALGAIWALAAERPERTVEAHRRTLRLTFDVAGTLEAIDTIQLGPPQLSRYWNFQIVRLAPEGSQVEEGTPVLAFDTSDLERRLEDYSSRAEKAAQELEKRRHEVAVRLEDLRLRLGEAESTRGRAALKVEVPEGIVADRDLEIARLDERIAEQQVAALEAQRDATTRAVGSELAGLERLRDQARQRVRELEDSIRQMTVQAPRAGTVIYLELGDRFGRGGGEKPKVGDSVWQGAKLVEIPNLESMQAEGWVDEVELGRLALDQRVRLRLDAHPEVEYGGRLERVGHTVARESESIARKVVEVRIALDRTDPARMRPGMRFRGEIEHDRLEGVLAVPLEAVIATPEGPRVRVRRRGGWKPVAVELGERDAGHVEVRAGLEEGERVALAQPPEAVSP